MIKVKKSELLTKALYDLLHEHYPEANSIVLSKELHNRISLALTEIKESERVRNPQPGDISETALARAAKKKDYWALRYETLNAQLHPPEPLVVEAPVLNEVEDASLTDVPNASGVYDGEPKDGQEINSD